MLFFTFITQLSHSFGMIHSNFSLECLLQQSKPQIDGGNLSMIIVDKMYNYKFLI